MTDRYTKAVLTVIAVALLVGCAVQKELIATGGSRADGVVELSYEIGEFQKPEFTSGQGLATATERCLSWGYPGAEPFGGERRECQYSSQYGCHQWLVTVPYQCTGAGPA